MHSIDAGKLQEAVLFGQQSVSHWPSDPELRHYLGIAYLKTGDLKQAEDQLAHARDLSPKDPAIRFDLALVFLSQENYPAAADELEASTKLDPSNALAHVLLGRAYLNSNRSLQAIDEFKTALKIEPDIRLGHYHLGFAYSSLGRDDEAIVEYKEELRRSGESPAVVYELGRSLLERGQYDAAISSLQRASQLDPANADAWYNLGKAQVLAATIRRGGDLSAQSNRTESHRSQPALSVGASSRKARQEGRCPHRARALRRTQKVATPHRRHGHRARPVTKPVTQPVKMTTHALGKTPSKPCGSSVLLRVLCGWRFEPSRPDPTFAKRATLLIALVATGLLAAAQLPRPPASPQKSKLAAKAPAPSAPLFVDVTRAAGIDFHLNCGSKEKLYIVETQCGGAAAFDYDNDGWLDILLIDGSSIEDYKAGKCHPPKLYHNNHDGTFTDVSAKSGLNFCGWGYGVAIGDYDNDGWEDVYITGY